MAFMMPVMKNEFDIYNGSRSRKISEGSNASSGRSRKASESKSDTQSYSTSPANVTNNDYMSPTHRNQMNRSYSKGFSRNSSRTSQNSFVMSPTRSYSQSSSPPKSMMTNNSSTANPTAAVATNGSQGSINKFHLRLVDKLRKSFRKDTAKRS